MTVTGNLKDVMRESISAANSYVRSRAIEFGVKPPLFRTRDIHVHVPEGATPKDGPSAGVAMATAIVSVLTGTPIRKDVAMTGEITLRGRVLPIGGLKEKLLAALRGGLRTVLIPKDNEKDLAEIPDNVKKGLEIMPVATVDEVLAKALARAADADRMDRRGRTGRGPPRQRRRRPRRRAPALAGVAATRLRSGVNAPLSVSGQRSAAALFASARNLSIKQKSRGFKHEQSRIGRRCRRAHGRIRR